MYSNKKGAILTDALLSIAITTLICLVTEASIQMDVQTKEKIEELIDTNDQEIEYSFQCQEGCEIVLEEEEEDLSLQEP